MTVPTKSRKPARRGNPAKEITDAIVKVQQLHPRRTERTDISANLHVLLTIGGQGKRQAVPSSFNQIQDQLRDVQAAAQKLLAAFEKLNKKAAGLYRDPALLSNQVRIIGIIACFGAETTQELFSEMSGQTGVALPVEQPVRPPVWLALHAAFVFYEEAGHRPTLRCADGKKYGPYFDFLAAIFKARGLRASVENCGKEALALMGTYGDLPSKKAG